MPLPQTGAPGPPAGSTRVPCVVRLTHQRRTILSIVENAANSTWMPRRSFAMREKSTRESTESRFIAH